MRAPCKILVFTVLQILSFTQCEKEPENKLPEPEFDIPDKSFLNALIEEGVDTNGDGLISIAEARAISSLDIKDNIYLRTIDCSDNQLTDLDVSKNDSLILLRCRNNLLNELDISGNLILVTFSCSGNSFSTLDVVENVFLRVLVCSDNYLNTLDVSNNINLTQLRIKNMPALREVCVWTTPFPPEDVYVSADGSPNVFFTTDCNQ